ncbi:Rho GTPase activation protein [Chytridium lagenaria]|nr:Rho GTPase activation protein [Chytridium lagenaria]
MGGGLGKKKWWALFKKDPKDSKDSQDQLVLKTTLCKSIDYASIPCEPDDSFNLRRVPILVYECCKYIRANGLKANGIFRVNGSEKRILQLAGIFDTGPRYGHGFNFEGYTTYDVADLLKKYVRTLPEPLLTSELYPFYLKCLDIPVENGARCKAFRWLCMLLPPPHLVLLEYLLELFTLVDLHSDSNQMTAKNLARIFSPNILRPKNEKQALEEFQSCAFVLEFMIENHDNFGYLGH